MMNIYTYKDLKNYKIESKDEIPKIIFRTSHYRLKFLPKEIIDLYEEEMSRNNGYKLFYFDDDDCKNIVNDTNDEKLIEAYNILNAGAYKADLVRYILLYKFGGIYMDFSMSTLKNLDEIINGYKLVLVKDLEKSLNGIYNAFMCSNKGNKLFLNVIESAKENILKRKYYNNVWELTGPILLKNEFVKFHDTQLVCGKIKDNIFIYKLVDVGLIGNVHYIRDEIGNDLVKTRKENHYKILYTEQKKSYVEMINDKKVFKKIRNFKSYEEFKKIKIESSLNEIPKLIFRTGSSKIDNLPDEIFNLYEETLLENEGYQMFYFDDNDRHDFIKDNFEEKYIVAYRSLIPKAYQADFFRYLVLYKHGGIYMDFSMKPLIPLKDIIKDYKNVYVRDRLSMPIIYNAFIATIKNSEILDLCISKCLHNIQNENYGYHALCVTSPIILGETIFELGINYIDGLVIGGKIQVGEINKDLFIYSFEEGDGENFKNPQNNQFVVKNKIDNHYDLLYKNKYNVLRYDALWNNKMVFMNDTLYDIESKYYNYFLDKIEISTLLMIYNILKNSNEKKLLFEKFVELECLYRTYLRRSIDEDGLNSYISKDLEHVKNALLNSHEYHQIK